MALESWKCCRIWSLMLKAGRYRLIKGRYHNLPFRVSHSLRIRSAKQSLLVVYLWMTMVDSCKVGNKVFDRHSNLFKHIEKFET